MTDLVKSWQNFTSFENATKYLRSKGKRRTIRKFLKVLNHLPYVDWETSVTNIKWMSFSDITLMSRGMKEFKGEVIVSPNAIAGQCHKVAALDKKLNPAWKLCVGFAMSEECASTEWHYHSFCVNEHGNIVEPTTHERERYVGVIVS